MEDHHNNSGQEDLDSLFEGMVLMTTSQFDSMETLEIPASEPPQQPLPDNDSAGTTSATAVSRPLDENLFSDLNLYPAGEDPILENPNYLGLDLSGENNSSFRKGSPSTSAPSVEASRRPLEASGRSLEAYGAKQGSRRKKRSFKIGYGRDDYVLDDGLQNNNNNNHNHNYNHVYDSNNNVSSVDVYASSQGQANVAQMQSLPMQNAQSNLSEKFAIHEKRPDSVETETVQLPSLEVVENSIHLPESEAVAEERKEADVKSREIDDCSTLQGSVQIEEQSSKDDGSGAIAQVNEEPIAESAGQLSIEKRLDDVKGQISMKLKELHERAAGVSMSRKVAAQRRRQAAEQVTIVSKKYKEIEKELEEACEREDFEKAESLSESLAIVEKSKQAAIHAFRSAETECDSLALKMQEILESQVVIEEEGIQILEYLQKEAEDIAAAVIREAEDFAAKEMDKWLVEKEALELSKMEVDLELKVIEDADEKLKESIDDSVRDDVDEKNILFKKRDTLMQELEDLLALVKAKQEAIFENDIKIQDVEKRISGMASKFEDERAIMKAKSEELMSVHGQLESKSDFLSMKKMEVDNLLASAEMKRVNLVKLAGDAGEEARVLQELVGMRKSIASSFLKSRENKVRLAEKEQQILEEIQDLRQQVEAARASLQELSSAKTNLHQEIASMKEKISFIEKRVPELEAEKKVAAAARNFKEAGRVAAEAKKLGIEKDTATSNMERALSELDNLEGETQGKVTALQEAENLIISKERDAAMARCERLRLVAASAREEQSAALDVEDLEEAGNLLAEAEAADSEADKLQEACNFDGEQFMKISRQSISVAMASTLVEKQLPEKTSLVETNVE